MASICNTCNRPIKGKKRDHVCNMARLSDGRVVHADRLRDGGDVRKEIEEGKVTVEHRYINDQPVKTISEKFGERRSKSGLYLPEGV